jgi:hypothetical protein
MTAGDADDPGTIMMQCRSHTDTLDSLTLSFLLLLIFFFFFRITGFGIRCLPCNPNNNNANNNSCPVDNSIFPSFLEAGNALESSYEAFRFTESYGVIFQCNVKYCIGRCEPVCGCVCMSVVFVV